MIEDEFDAITIWLNPDAAISFRIEKLTRAAYLEGKLPVSYFSNTIH